MVLGGSQGYVPFLAARVAPESTVSLAIAIMSVSMFDLATSHNGEGLFWGAGRVYGKNIHSEHAQQIHGRESRIGTSKSDTLALETDTSLIRGPCGRSCPFQSLTMALMGFSAGARATMSSESSGIVMLSSE